MKNTVLKITTILFVVLCTMLSGCEGDEVENDGNSGNNNVDPYGSWSRGDGGEAYVKFDGTTAITCFGGVATTGSFDASEPSMTFVISGETITFPLRFNDDDTMLLGVPEQAINTNNATLYHRSGQFPCNAGGSSGNGNLMFWTSSDLGCGSISVSVEGQSGSITQYYYNGTPECGAGGCANFTLPAGTYNFTASCSTHNWNSTITVSGGSCSKMRLY
ncbi:hypothetical protein [uncultured Flavobacterium sp.]|uniref:hypothetical protein n=1 Tax=uncultured Flavobacterium sp. TaxID=165435 RepID=UPI0025D6EC56|nr:hypothetical protein [uncultured Flavobacterium sp.]